MMRDRCRMLFERELTGNRYLRVEIAYDSGEVSYVTGAPRQRGYYLSCCPVKEEDGMMCVEAFSGKCLLLQAAKRFSRKTLEAIRPTQEQIDKLIVAVTAKLN